MFIFFLVRWLKFKLFWFFLLALCVGKNQMGLNVRWAVALLLTLAVWLVADFEALSYQGTTTFDKG